MASSSGAAKRFGRYELKSVLAMEAGVLLPVVTSWSGAIPPAVYSGIHLLSFTFLFGMQLWVTFIASIVMMKYLPHREFCQGLSTTLSAYFNLESVLGGLCIGSYIANHPYSSWTSTDLAQIGWLLLIVATTLPSNLYWHQTCIHKMAEQQKREDAGANMKDIPWYQKGYAAGRSEANLLSVAGSVAHWLHLAGTGAGYGYLHLAVFSLTFGSQLWTTFVAGIVLIRTLSRHMFGRVQRGLFPVYFVVQTASSAFLLYSYVLNHITENWGWTHYIQIAALSLVSSTSVVSLVHVVPLNLRIMEEMHKVEKEEGHGHEVGMGVPEALKGNHRHRAIHKKFAAAHGLSMLLNLAGVIATFVHLFHVFAVSP